MKKLYVHVYSGLMSRCCTLADAYRLAKHYQKELVVIWPISKDCNISYYDIFERNQFLDIPFRIIEVNADGICIDSEGKVNRKIHVMTKTTELWHRFSKSYLDYEPPKEIGWSGELYLENIKIVWQKIFKRLESGEGGWIHAYCGIVKIADWREVGMLCFKKMYWDIVDELLPQHSNIIGVHIRRTDHTVCIERSKTEWFIEKMDHYIAKDSGEGNRGIKFFLATDDPREEQKLQELYGERIITYTDKTWGRDSLSGMQTGIIECLCLSRCNNILGSCTSVFSNFAALYGGSKLIVNE